MIAAIHALVLTLALAVPYVAHGECAWVLWSQSPEGYTVVGAHPTVRDCAVATTETVMALQQQGFTARSVPGESPKDVEVIVRKVLHGLLGSVRK